MDRPVYTHSAVQSVNSLARALSLPEALLRSVEKRVLDLYIGPKPKPKKNGGTRYVYDTKAPLKPLLRTINQVVFKAVKFPPYLTGAISGSDFIANVRIHRGAKSAFSEDIATFFDHITADQVHRVWREFFRFGPEVAALLTNLTTREGRVFQGTPTSSYLANLAFWDREPALVQRLADRGIRYSRYVDDLTVSSKEAFDSSTKTWVLAQVYGMIGGAGFKPQREKHVSLRSSAPMKIMGLNANSRNGPSIPKAERAEIRAQVHRIATRIAAGESGPEVRALLAKSNGRVSKLKRLHPVEAEPLRMRLREAADLLARLNATIEQAARSMPTAPGHAERGRN